MLEVSQRTSQNGSSAAGMGLREVRECLAFAFDESPLAVIAVSMGGEIVYVNPVMRERTGFAAGDMLGRNASIIHPRFDAADRQVRNVLASGEAWSGRIWGKAKNGEVRWIHADLSPLRDGDGTVGYCLALCRELGDPSSGQGWKPVAVPSNAEAAFFMISDLEGVIQFEPETVSGLSQEDVIHASLFDFVPPDQHDRVRSNMEKVTCTGEEATYETTAVGPDGKESQYVTRIAPIKRDDDVVALSFTSYDITSPSEPHTSVPASSHRWAPRTSERRTRRRSNGRRNGRPVLSKREQDVLRLLAHGLTNRDAAVRLRLSSRTIDHHVGHILRKLDVPNRTAAVLAARGRGLLARQQGNYSSPG